MKNSKFWILAAAVAVVSALILKDVVAQSKPDVVPDPNSNTRVAVVDVVKIFANYQRAKDLEIKLTERRKTIKLEDEGRAKKIESMEQELRDGLNPASAEYEKRLGELTKASVERESWLKFEDAREMQERFRLTDDMYKEVCKVTGVVARQLNFQLVINSDDTNADPKQDIFRKIDRKKVVYAESSIDITDQVLSKLNELYKAGNK
jgi:Skp family chaperone for outer membrane proteins